MSSASMLSVCLAAFISIFLLLTILSVMMRVLTFLLRPVETGDTAVIAAVTTAYHSAYPDSKVTGIKEVTK